MTYLLQNIYLTSKNNGRGMGIGGPAGADGKLVLHWNIKSETTDLAVGLNADYIDGKHASDFVPTSRKINGRINRRHNYLGCFYARRYRGYEQCFNNYPCKF